MDLGAQEIERRDFPISRRGYEPAAVDAHLKEVADAVAELEHRAQHGETLSSSAAGQLQSILDAAEQAAAGVRSEAQLSAAQTRQEAERDAARTRSEAIARAEHLINVVQGATQELQRQLETMDGRVKELAEGLLAGMAQLTGRLGHAQQAVAGIFDSAEATAQPPPAATGGEAAGAPATGEAAGAPATDGAAEAAVAQTHHEPLDGGAAEEAPAPTRRRPRRRAAARPKQTARAPEGKGVAGKQSSAEPATDVQAASRPANGAPPARTAAGQAGGGMDSQAATAPSPPPAEAQRSGTEEDELAPPHGRSSDIDGARLVALNMALNGESRERTGRYLAESFDLQDAEKLLEEVYAAIEG